MYEEIHGLSTSLRVCLSIAPPERMKPKQETSTLSLCDVFGLMCMYLESFLFQISMNVVVLGRARVTPTPFAITPKDLMFVNVWMDMKEMDEIAKVESHCLSSYVLISSL